MALGQWLFRSRVTGRISIVSWPNAPLWVWIAATVIRRLAAPHGAFATALDVVGTGALLVWAGDELCRGVNPWRRLLGFSVLVVVVSSWFGR